MLLRDSDSVYYFLVFAVPHWYASDIFLNIHELGQR